MNIIPLPRVMNIGRAFACSYLDNKNPCLYTNADGSLLKYIKEKLDYKVVKSSRELENDFFYLSTGPDNSRADAGYPCELSGKDEGYYLIAEKTDVCIGLGGR